MTTAVIYARFSPRRNAEECDSIETQMDACRRYCKSQGFEVAAEFEDREASRNDDSRPGLLEAVAAIRKGGVLVVHRRDRLASGELGAIIAYQIRKRGGMIHAVEGGMNDDSPMAHLANAVLDAVAEFERQMIGVRTKHSMQKYQRDGRLMGSVPPYGKKRGPDGMVSANGQSKRRRTLIDDPEEQAVLRMILDCHERGWSPSEIASYLDGRGILCRGKKWQRQSVGRICARNEAAPAC